MPQVVGSRYGFDAADELLFFQAIADQIGDGAHLEIVLAAEGLQLRPARHLAVFAHDLDCRARGIQPGEATEIGHAFGVSGTNQHPAFAGADGLDMTGTVEVFISGIAIAEPADGGGALEGADAGRDAEFFHAHRR